MNEAMMSNLIKMTIPLIAIIGLFTYLSVSAWANARKREREAFYRSEVRKKIIEHWGKENAEQMAKLLQEESESSGLRQLYELARDDKADDPRRRRERLVLAGLITAAVGLGMLIFLRSMSTAHAVSNAGVIPLIVGIALLAYSFFVGRS